MTSTDLPKFVDDFDYAVIRLATFQATRESHPRLLFGSVTLLTIDRPVPDSMPCPTPKNLRGGTGRIYFRRVVMRAREAVSWYRSAGVGELTTPIPARNDEVNFSLDGKVLTTSDFVDDPKWPTLGFPLQDDVFSDSDDLDNPAPFAGDAASRVHRRFGNRSGFDILLNDQSAIDFLARRLHLHLSNYPEYLGSLALVVPDPMVERIQNFLIPAKDGQPEKSFFRFVARPGQSLEGLSMTLFERHARMLSSFTTTDVPLDGILTLERAEEIAASGYVITHPVHGVLLVQPPVHFLRQINFSINTVGRRRDVSVPSTDAKRARQTSFSSNEITDVSQRTIGEALEVQGRDRVFEAIAMRKTKAAARKYDQHWFEDGQREEALQFIRSRLMSAKERVIIADPYFGFLQILQVLPAIARPAVPVTVLTSRLAFEEAEFAETVSAGLQPDVPKEPPGEEQASRAELRAERELAKLAEFEKCQNELLSNGVVNLDALILPGARPALHDRFLVIDNRVWFLGNSLNALGTRASLILQVPDGEDVVRRLLKMAGTAKSFLDYASQRRVDLGKQTPGKAE